MHLTLALVIVVLLVCAGLAWQMYGRMRTWPASTPVTTAPDNVGGEPFFSAGLLSDADPAWWPTHADGMGIPTPITLSWWQQWQIDHLTDHLQDKWVFGIDPNWTLFSGSTKESRGGDCKAYARVCELNLRAMGIPGAAMTYGFGTTPLGIWHCTLWLFTERGAYIFSIGERLCKPWRDLPQSERRLALQGVDTPDGSVLRNGMNYPVIM